MSPSLSRGFVGRLARAVLLPLTVLCASSAASAAVDPSELLPVDQVFVLSADAPSRDRITLHWTIADGYYLYRHRIGVQSATPDFAGDALQLPHGDKHHDEFFGDVETFRKQLTAIQPGRAADGATIATVRVKYQGCADAGVCYPPQVRTLTVALPGAAPTPQADEAGDSGFGALARSLAGGNTPAIGLRGGNGNAEPLPAEQAFGFEA